MYSTFILCKCSLTQELMRCLQFALQITYLLWKEPYSTAQHCSHWCELLQDVQPTGTRRNSYSHNYGCCFHIYFTRCSRVGQNFNSMEHIKGTERQFTSTCFSKEYLHSTCYSFMLPSTNNNTKGRRLNEIKLGMAGVTNSYESFLIT